MEHTFADRTHNGEQDHVFSHTTNISQECDKELRTLTWYPNSPHPQHPLQLKRGWNRGPPHRKTQSIHCQSPGNRYRRTPSLVPRSRPDRRFGGVRGSSIRSGNVLADHHYIHNCVFMSVYTHVLRSSPLYLKWQDYRWAFIFFLNIVHIFRKENSVARGVQWVAMCNPTTRCHKILLYGP